MQEADRFVFKSDFLSLFPSWCAKFSWTLSSLKSKKMWRISLSVPLVLAAILLNGKLFQGFLHFAKSSISNLAFADFFKNKKTKLVSAEKIKLKKKI